MTQQQLAARFQFQQTAISDWERRGKQPSYKTLIELAKFFGVTVGYLLGHED